VSFDELRLALAQSCGWADAAVAETCAALAATVVSLDELLHPEQFVIGGGFAVGLPGVAGLVREHVAGLVRTGQATPRVRAALLGERASLDGAELLARGLA
jgi:kanosamine 6-kinase